jgi:hypothetical protein
MPGQMTTASPRVWGVRPQVPALAGALFAAFAIWLSVADSQQDRLVAAAGAVLMAVSAALLLTMRRRLTVDPVGVTLRGPTGSRHLRWDQVVAINAPTRRRRGLASTSVELDLENDGLIVLSKTELGADPGAVAEELRRFRRSSMQ